MKKCLAIILSIVCILSFSHLCAYANDIESYESTHCLGAVADSYADIMSVLDTSEPARTLLSAVDNTSSFPSPGSQGSQGSCTCWAICYAMKSNSEFIKRGWTVTNPIHHFSPSYIYNQLNGGSNSGVGILTSLHNMKQKGCCTMSYFPYNASDYTTQPTDIQNANAQLYKVQNYYSINSLTAIKNQISNGRGVVIAVQVYPDMDNISTSNQVYDDTTGISRGNHAICLIGYDDNKGSNGAFKFINSWGTSWGLNGYGWISYALVDNVDNVPVNINGASVGYYMTYPSTDNYTLGDIDEDGVVDTEDARLALRIAVGLNNPTASQYVLCDVNGDASVDTSDAREILRYATGIISHFSLYD